MDKAKLIELAKKNINLHGLAVDVMAEILEPALDKFVADSANPYDDMLKAALWPVLKKELEEQLKKAIDSI